MTLELPDAIAAYMAARNARDPAAMLAGFAPDALVRDDGQTLTGHGPIRQWMEEINRRFATTTQVAEVSGEGDLWTVLALVSGTFAGSPATFRYDFRLCDGLIGALDIALAK